MFEDSGSKKVFQEEKSHRARNQSVSFQLYGEKDDIHIFNEQKLVKIHHFLKAFLQHGQESGQNSDVFFLYYFSNKVKINYFYLVGRKAYFVLQYTYLFGTGWMLIIRVLGAYFIFPLIRNLWSLSLQRICVKLTMWKCPYLFITYAIINLTNKMLHTF